MWSHGLSEIIALAIATVRGMLVTLCANGGALFVYHTEAR